MVTFSTAVAYMFLAVPAAILAFIILLLSGIIFLIAAGIIGTMLAYLLTLLITVFS